MALSKKDRCAAIAAGMDPKHVDGWKKRPYIPKGRRVIITWHAPSATIRVLRPKTENAFVATLRSIANNGRSLSSECLAEMSRYGVSLSRQEQQRANKRKHHRQSKN